MKKCLSLLFFVITINVFGQNCTSCTQTISTATTSNITVNNGDVLCITSTGTLNGNIFMNGGQVCNDGVLNGNILMSDGLFNNYGTIQGSSNSINHDKGTFNNYGQIDIGSYTAVGVDIVIYNEGRIEASFLDLDFNGPGGRTSFTNEGILYLNYIIVDSSDLFNNDSITLTGNLTVGADGYFHNDGAVSIGGNCNFGMVTSRVHTNCVINVAGNLNNSGTITGPMSACGGFYINGFANNQASGNLGMDNSYLDICEQGNSNGLNNLGNLGSNFTQCSCNNTCLVTTEILESNGVEEFEIYPNPFNQELIFSSANVNSLVQIYDIQGKCILEFKIDNSYRNINASNWKSGLYLIRVNNKTYKFIKA